jgi:TonB family protein
MNPIPPRSYARCLCLPALALALLLTGNSILPAAEKEAVAPETARVKPPVPTKRVTPVHPAELQKKLVNGQATVECVVTETGEIKEVKTLSASQPEFGKAAEEALRQWEFRPGEQAGKPVSVRLQVPFEFRLTGEQMLEAALGRQIFVEIHDTIIAAKELPAWPRPLQFLLPRYPESLKGSGKYGKAVVSVVINKEGKVMNPTIVKATYPEFMLPALVTAARLEFPPQVMANGVHIFVSMEIQFDFKADADRPVPKEKPKKS